MVDQAVKNEVEDLRSEEQWLRYDTEMVGHNAKRVTASWSENLAEFANKDLLTFNDGTRTKTIGKSWCNQSGNTEDFAQEIYQSGVEFFCYVGNGRATQSAFDAVDLPTIWLSELPYCMNFSFKLQDTDEHLLVPGIHLPGLTGTNGTVVSDPGLPLVKAGHTGIASFRDGWNWPKPLQIPAKKKLVVEVLLDKPLKQFLQALDGNPSTATYIVNDGANPGQTKEVTRDLWCGIRVWHRGPRRVQLRGGYTA